MYSKPRAKVEMELLDIRDAIVQSQWDNSVLIHFRCGDIIYRSIPYFGLLTLSFYLEAFQISFFLDTLNAVFFPKWHFHILYNTTIDGDFYRLSAFRHVICSMSSFCLGATIANGNNVIIPAFGPYYFQYFSHEHDQKITKQNFTFGYSFFDTFVAKYVLLSTHRLLDNRNKTFLNAVFRYSPGDSANLYRNDFENMSIFLIFYKKHAFFVDTIIAVLLAGFFETVLDYLL
ncbi:hypothetical protein RFI_03832 [Reticulomyxa filosa]|uniref:Uncharacterized protein n=1 Tax=Reticulomyxa filosa TaxID=46433 RepID=X6P6N2_RETFI|nr:hypothetical protein RFI_03832 [Reticulomyxa filosa]|eukprot:ETO33277.1 hypothetical protein RFI_03832 [Reticulomyxa filosa]